LENDAVRQPGPALENVAAQFADADPALDMRIAEGLVKLK
jgi:hypothetical protein